MAAPNHAKQQILEGDINPATDTIKVLLLNDSTAYTFDPDTHEFVDDVVDGGTTGTEFSGGSYSRQTLTNVTITQDDTNDKGVFDADNTVFSGLDSQDIQTIIVYKQVGGDDTTPGDDPVLAVLDDDSAGSLVDLPFPTNGSDVTITWDSQGIIDLG